MLILAQLALVLLLLPVSIREYELVLRSVAYVSVSVCLSVRPVRALTFEILDLETSFWYIFRMPIGQVWISRSSGKGQGRRSRVDKTSITI